MLSFEEKKAIFQSFKLKEKQYGNGKVSFVYPESIQKGQVLATQLHPSGNGYVIGKYMSDETIRKHGYQVDPRGWISIKVFSKEEIAKVITEAINSMSGGEIEALLPVIETEEKIVPQAVNEEMVSKVDEESLEVESSEILEKDGSEKAKNAEEPAKQGTYEFYPGSYLSAWMGLTLSTMEYGYLVWRKAFRKYVGFVPSDVQKNEK
ncbi:hypothetical protein [Neobacillus cucumis]|uniref:Uncharacterized protein n=1 Tax=Neobacillus cucumis TaxID=1740721 RepID=A0A2N5HC55_9BACI|nr:hypothetical protein [Neobacillus cucumis]PLS03096.1 hypothetical protein CVD27_15640 [Neobacillus cucumis]